MRHRLGRYGLRVICLACKSTTRHFPAEHGRLRNRCCPFCRTPYFMHAFWWVRLYPTKAAAEVKAASRVMATLDADSR